jgi:hypothetical protein
MVKQALWSDRKCGVGPSALREFVDETKTMRYSIGIAHSRYPGLRQNMDALQRQLEAGLKPPADSALQGVEKLGNSIVALHHTPDQSYEATKDLVVTCKGQSKVVAEWFNALHQQVADILKKVGDVSLVRVCTVVPKLTSTTTLSSRISSSAQRKRPLQRVGPCGSARWRRSRTG